MSLFNPLKNLVDDEDLMVNTVCFWAAVTSIVFAVFSFVVSAGLVTPDVKTVVIIALTFLFGFGLFLTITALYGFIKNR